MREVYLFFGFGEYFIRLSETLGNGRCAKIILDCGRYSDTIELARCRPQGDSPSPRQFNMCQQICIFKIELDPTVRSVYLSFLVPRQVPGVLVEQENLVTEEEKAMAEEQGYVVSTELQTTRKKVSSFADDLQATVRAEFESLNRIKETMIQFGVISGLCTNVEKTTMMRIGNRDTVLDPRIADLGFVMVDTMKILGFEIDSRVERLGVNFDKCISKMRQVVGNWSRFRLTLPGRIAIAKSLLLSQITFPGTVLDPDPGQLNEMNTIIESFVTHNLVIAKERIYAPVAKGGLGLIRIDTFLAAQKCAWIRRCFNKINDAWRWEFLTFSNFSLSTVRMDNFSRDGNPLLWSIANAVCQFQMEYWKKNENFMEAPVFDNEFFLCEKPRPRAALPGCIKLTRIRREIRNAHFFRLRMLKMKNIFDDGTVLDFHTFCARTDIPFTVNEYMYISTGARYARERYGNKPNSTGKSECIIAGIYAKKGSSKKYRQVLDLKYKYTPVLELRTVRTFTGLVNVEITDPDWCGFLVSIWNLHMLPNNIRWFAFQFFNNSLPIGTRLAARYRADPLVRINDLCTFCTKANAVNPVRESFCHLFFECPQIENCVSRYTTKYGGPNFGVESRKKFFFTGSEEEDWTNNAKINAVHNLIFMYGIWCSKLARKIPNFVTIEENMLTIFDAAVSISVYWTEIASTGTSLICRLWRHRSGRG